MMKHFQLIIPIVLFLITALAMQSADSAKNIMIHVDKAARESYDTTAAILELSTCKYFIKKNRMHCTERPRVAVLENVQKVYGDAHRDSKAIAIVLEPVSDKGIGMLTYEYDEMDKDNDTWLYLSALGKVKRIVTSNDDGDSSGSFFGSEFSLEDMQSRKIEEYTYKILEEETYADHPVWVIELTPTKKKAARSKYGKIVVWVDKDRLLILKEHLYDRNGKLYKQRIFGKIEQVDNVWVARRVIMNNISARRATTMEMSSVAFNIPVADEFLTQRSLTDFAFRERNLTKIRTYFK